MRVWVAAASGVIGSALSPLLLQAGLDVAGMTRSGATAETVAKLGPVPVVCDVFDRTSLVDAVTAWAPEVVIHQLTDLPDAPALIRDHLAATARVRTEGTRNLVGATQGAAASRFIAQSVAWLPATPGGAIAEVEQMALDARGPSVRPVVRARHVLRAGAASCAPNPH